VTQTLPLPVRHLLKLQQFRVGQVRVFIAEEVNIRIVQFILLGRLFMLTPPHIPHDEVLVQTHLAVG